MTISNSVNSSRRSKFDDMLAGARRRIGSRRGLLVLAGFALALGLVFKWNWLVAAGVAPVLVSLLPCAAMCVLGFCAHKMNSAAATKAPSADADADSNLKS